MSPLNYSDSWYNNVQFNYNYFRKCPVILTTALAHETYLRVSSCNLNEALVEFASEKEGSSGDSVDSNRDGDGQDTSEKNQGTVWFTEL